MRDVTDSEALAELGQLRKELDIMFRQVEGPPRAGFFSGNWTTAQYQVVALAAEVDRDGAESFWAPKLVQSMRYVFQTVHGRGGRILVWRRGFEFQVYSGGDRVPDLISLNCRLAILGENCVPFPLDEWAKREGDEPRYLTREQLEEGRA